MNQFTETRAIVNRTVSERDPLALSNVFQGVIFMETHCIIVIDVDHQSFLLGILENGRLDSFINFLRLFCISRSQKLFECCSNFLANPVTVRHCFPHQLLDGPFEEPTVSFFDVAYDPKSDFIFFFLAPLRVF